MKIYERRRHRALLGAHSAMRVVRRDRKWQIVVLSLISGAILLGLSEIDVPPYHTELTYQDSMFGYGVGVNGVNFPNERLNIQALSPNDTIHISIPDSGHWVLDYKIYFVNDTNRAVGFGPSKLLFSGETSTGTNLTINNAEYNMTYRLVLTSPANQSFFSTVTVKQKEILYPPANYWALIPGIFSTITALVVTGYKLTAVGSDRYRYYSSLGLAIDAEAGYVTRISRFNSGECMGAYMKYFNVMIGIAFCALGFAMVGGVFILAWLGIGLIVTGLVFILNGLVRIVLKS